MTRGAAALPLRANYDRSVFARTHQPTTGAGRFAPTPSGELHLGNLRTALLAWLFARRSGRAFLVRVEDIDAPRVRPGMALRQLDELATLGLDWDGKVIYQSQRTAAYAAAMDQLEAAGLVYQCYCTRRDIQAAPSAPHAAPGSYPGTCRDLPDAARRAKRAGLVAAGRTWAWRLRSQVGTWAVRDELHGEVTAAVDDFVLARGAMPGAVYAYNLAVVVDDAAQGVDQVVRGDDLLSSAPRQAYLAHLLGHPQPVYAHVPLALGPEGKRLAKRDGAVTLEALARDGVGSGDVLTRIACSLGLARPGELVTPAQLLERFDPAALPREPWSVEL